MPMNALGRAAGHAARVVEPVALATELDDLAAGDLDGDAREETVADELGLAVAEDEGGQDGIDDPDLAVVHGHWR